MCDTFPSFHDTAILTAAFPLSSRHNCCHMLRCRYRCCSGRRHCCRQRFPYGRTSTRSSSRKIIVIIGCCRDLFRELRQLRLHCCGRAPSVTTSEDSSSGRSNKSCGGAVQARDQPITTRHSGSFSCPDSALSRTVCSVRLLLLLLFRCVCWSCCNRGGYVYEFLPVCYGGGWSGTAVWLNSYRPPANADAEWLVAVCTTAAAVAVVVVCLVGLFVACIVVCMLRRRLLLLLE